MENTLGSIIGKVEKVFKVTNENKETVTLRNTFDWTNMTDDQIIGMAMSTAVIRRQAVLRKLSASELKELDGLIIDVTQVGKEIESFSAQQEKVRAILEVTGMGKKEIDTIVKDPEKVSAILARVSKK